MRFLSSYYGLKFLDIFSIGFFEALNMSLTIIFANLFSIFAIKSLNNVLLKLYRYLEIKYSYKKFISKQIKTNTKLD